MTSNYCCKELEQHLREKEVGIVYDRTSRWYGIKILDGGSSSQTIHYCPWCGTKLPKDLSDELGKIVFEELELDGFDDPRLPEEFKSDEWWKKRGF